MKLKLSIISRQSVAADPKLHAYKLAQFVVNIHTKFSNGTNSSRNGNRGDA
jgi:hypothetical protein